MGGNGVAYIRSKYRAAAYVPVYLTGMGVLIDDQRHVLFPRYY